MPTKKSSTNKAKSGKKPSAAATAMASQAAQSAVIRAAVPQWFKIDPDQVQGAAGGYVWQISDKEQVVRYLIIGSEGGNYYQTPQQVSTQCASCVLRMTRNPDNFKWLLETIRQVSIEGRAAKQESTLLALATAIVFAPTSEAKTEALNSVKDCVRILTHMYMLIGYIKIFSKAGHPSLGGAVATGGRAPPVVGSGFGRGIRRVFGDYFYSRSGIEVANLITKYQNREGWTIKDVLTLIHIDPKKMKDDGGRLAIEHIFKTKEEFAPILDAAPSTPTTMLFRAIKEIHTMVERPPCAIRASTAGLSNYQYAEELDKMVHLINTVGLCREQLPSQLFKHRKIWEALLMSKGANGKGKGMPLTALIRNLGKLSTNDIKIIEPRTTRDQTPDAKRAYSFTSTTAEQVFPPSHPQHYTEYIFRRLTNARDIKYARVHPYNILVAMLTYKKGCGDKGSLTWTPNIHIIDALDHAFKLAFQNITPTGKRIKIALDVSGSMSSAFCTGSPIVSCAVGSVAMMMMTLWVENNRRGVPSTAAAPPDPAAAAAAAATSSAQPQPQSQPQPSQMGEALKWKTTQLPDGRTLYEHSETKQCQFHKPEILKVAASAAAATAAATAAASTSTAQKVSPVARGGAANGNAPTLAEYKATKKYLGHPDAQPAAESRPSYGYISSYYSPPPIPYLPELYPAPAIPSNVTICAFSNTLTELTNAIVGYMDATIDPTTGLPTMSIDDALKLVEMPFSSTDCALPMVRALEKRELVDAFVIYTDSETYMGKIHPQVALEEYRKAMGIEAKLIVVGMTSNCLTIADPKDLNTLNLAGFDTATPRIINDFIAGGLAPQPRRSAAASASGAAAALEEEEDEFVMLDNE